MGCEKGCKLHKNKQLLKNCSGVIIKDTFGQEFDSPRLLKSKHGKCYFTEYASQSMFTGYGAHGFLMGWMELTKQVCKSD